VYGKKPVYLERAVGRKKRILGTIKGEKGTREGNSRRLRSDKEGESCISFCNRGGKGRLTVLLSDDGNGQQRR